MATNGTNNGKLGSNNTLRLIIGANGGIGSAVTRYWRGQKNVSTIAISRGTVKEGFLPQIPPFREAKVTPQHIKLQCEHSPAHIAWLVTALSKMPSLPTIDRIVITTGMLTEDYKKNNAIISQGPEKNLQQIQYHHWEASMRVNAWIPILWLQQLEPLLKQQKTPCVIAVLSARVGSIEDNQLGGWYSYRSSKAALNMLLKTTSIEWARTLPNIKLMAFHPGTTDTKLSKPFQKRVPKSKLFQPLWVAQQLDHWMTEAQINGDCAYIDWAGKPIAW